MNKVTFSYQEISNFLVLSKALNIDANAEASFAFNEFLTSIQYERLLESYNNDIVIAITTYRELKLKKKNGVLALTKKGKDLLATATTNNQLNLWRQIYKSDVITETVSGHYVTMLYQFSTSDSAKLETLHEFCGGMVIRFCKCQSYHCRESDRWFRLCPHRL